MADEYDEAIEYLTANPGELYEAWSVPGSSPGARLFRFVGSQANHYEAADGREVECGCLTMIRSYDGYGAFVRGEYDAALTERIRFDERIPQSGAAIRLDDLPVFAEWQRRLDKELGRT